MDAVLNHIFLVDLILCIVLVGLSYVGYQKSRDTALIILGVAFVLFGVSNLLTLVRLAATFELPLVIMRLVAYLAIIYVIYRLSNVKQ